MKLLDNYARAAGMSDEAWRRHANPWSVWTRFAAIPLMMLAIWSRVWIGWWALVPVGVVILWLWWNPHAFAPVDKPVAWSSRGSTANGCGCRTGRACRRVSLSSKEFGSSAR